MISRFRLPRRAFTLLELVVSIGLAALLVSAVLPWVALARSSANRSKCANNLQQIGMGLLLYANNHKNEYPRVRAGPSTQPTAFTGAMAANPFTSADAPEPNDVTAAMFMLVRYAGVDPEALVCGMSLASKWDLKSIGRTAQQVSNFPSDRHLSYSLTNPYPDAGARALGYVFGPKAQADFAVAADINPGAAANLALHSNVSREEMRPANSTNHRREGQNVLYNDGHVEWSTSPFCGANKDNIYAAARTVPAPGMTNVQQQSDPATTVAGVQPRLDLDSILLPVGTLPPAEYGSEAGWSAGALVGAGLIAVALVGIVLVGIMAAARAARRKAKIEPA